jgi:8-oxo-dGTP pyrophosphatase MutT (NUDIX family)
MQAVPRKAATVILLREGDSEEFEVFLLKRHEKSAFMGGMFVYPGGVVDKNDCSIETLQYYQGVPSRRGAIIPGISDEEVRGFIMAAIRELFEEGGVLLASHGTGQPIALNDDGLRRRFSAYRDMLNKREITLDQIARKEHLLFVPEEFYFYARWITPEARRMRFDTVFFVVRHPRGQEARPDGTETTEGLWVSPAEAIEGNRTGRIALSPPTFKTLEDIARFRSFDSLIDSLTGKEAKTVLPIFLPGVKEDFMIMPWDSEYERLKTGKINRVEKPGRQSTCSDNTTRFLVRNGRVIPYVA